jgi:4-hydroxybenzoate polyprenyltransferase
MSDPLTWPTWLQMVLVTLLLFGAALAWFTTGWGGLLVIAVGVLFGLYFRMKNSN